MATDDLDCKDLVEMVTNYFEGTLPPSEHARLEQHLTECDDCNEYLAQIKTTTTLVCEIAPHIALDERRRENMLNLFRTWRNAP